MDQSISASPESSTAKVLLTQSDLNILTLVLGYSKVPLSTRLETLEKASDDCKLVGKYILLHEEPNTPYAQEIKDLAKYYAEKMGVEIGASSPSNLSTTPPESEGRYKLLDLDSLRVAA